MSIENITPQAPPHFKTGEYTGDGNASQSITGAGFTPKGAMINNLQMIAFKWTSHPAGQGTRIPNTGSPITDANSIKTLDTDGITVGGVVNANEGNALGVAYRYILMG